MASKGKNQPRGKKGNAAKTATEEVATPAAAAPTTSTPVVVAAVPAKATAAAVVAAAEVKAAAAAAPAVAVVGAKGEAKDGKDAKDLTSADYYFDSYSHFGIHEEMLKDEVRTRTYQKAILQNKHLFAGKVVLDVGCGTGILSMFAAKAGAKHVYGVDCAGIVVQARKIVAANGFADKITIIQGKIEEIDLPVDKIDIIISEWMGYFLLYESMLDTVLYARDKWLVKDGSGLIFPDKANIYVCAIEDAEYREDKINFWDNVYGFDMSCIKEMALIEPLVDVCSAEQVLSNSHEVLAIDIYTVTKEELDFKSNFNLTVNRDDYCHAIVAYFNVEFSKTHTKHRFSTGPRSDYTHWKQTVFYLEEPIPCSKDQTISGTINVARNAKNPRDIDISFTTQLDGTTPKYQAAKSYRLR